MGFGEKHKKERKDPNKFEMLQARTEFPNHWQKRKQIENRFAAVSVPSPPPFFPFESSIQLTTQQF